MNKINILIIEDEAIIAMDLMMCLQQEGYTIAAAVNNGRDAIAAFESETVDMIICDINILGDWDGIETMTRLLKVRPVPFIYLTALSDRSTLERAKQTFPAAYIHKPFTITAIRIAIEMAMNNFAYYQEQKEKGQTDKEAPLSKVCEAVPDTDHSFILRTNDFLFIKQTHQFMKLNIHDILYLEVENKYVTILTVVKKYVLKDTLNNVLKHIAFPKLVRVHRSIVVNIEQIDVFNDTEIMVKKKTLPLGRTYKEDFMQSFRFSA
jgi:two-component system, response regulator PdtaR